MEKRVLIPTPNFEIRKPCQYFTECFGLYQGKVFLHQSWHQRSLFATYFIPRLSRIPNDFGINLLLPIFTSDYILKTEGALEQGYGLAVSKFFAAKVSWSSSE